MQMTTRQSFIKLAAASCVVAADAPLIALNHLDIGVGTYSYQNLSIDEMIVQLNRLRVSKIEMSRGRGVAGIPQVMLELHRQKFPGLIAFDYGREGDVDDDMVQELAFARNLA